MIWGNIESYFIDEFTGQPFYARIEQALEKATSKNASRKTIVSIVRYYWDHPERVERCEVEGTITELRIEQLAGMAKDSCWRRDFIKRAPRSYTMWEGLHSWALSEAKKGNSLPADIAELLLSTERPKKPSRQSTRANQRRDQEIYWVLMALRDNTNDYTAISKTETDPNNAITLTAEATGLSSSMIHTAWKRARAGDYYPA